MIWRLAPRAETAAHVFPMTAARFGMMRRDTTMNEKADMLAETIARIEESIRSAGVEKARREELLALVARLKGELQGLERTRRDAAHSIAGMAGIAAHEAKRQDKPEGLLDHAVKGLAMSVEGLEASHPELAETVNALCQMLANIGI